MGIPTSHISNGLRNIGSSNIRSHKAELRSHCLEYDRTTRMNTKHAFQWETNLHIISYFFQSHPMKAEILRSLLHTWILLWSAKWSHAHELTCPQHKFCKSQEMPSSSQHTIIPGLKATDSFADNFARKTFWCQDSRDHRCKSSVWRFETWIRNRLAMIASAVNRTHQ